MFDVETTMYHKLRLNGFELTLTTVGEQFSRWSLLKPFTGSIELPGLTPYICGDTLDSLDAIIEALTQLRGLAPDTAPETTEASD